MTNGSAEGDGPQLYKVYPLASVAAYNGTTLAHYALGALGMIVGYGKWPALGWTLGLAYLVFAVVQMYVLMPLMVCPGCVYRRMDGARCISALNLVSAKIAAERDLDDFPRRAQGAFCHNNLYLAALVLPLLLMLPALFLDFSVVLLAVFLGVAALLVFRLFVLFRKVACVHCIAKKRCPNAQSMGLA